MTHPFPPDYANLSRAFATGCRISLAAFLVFVVTGGHALVAEVPRVPHVDPETIELNPEQLKLIDAVVEEGINSRKMPGCVVAVGRSGGLAFLKAYGNRRLLPEPEAMTTDTVFDMASLTKPVATATSIMILVEQGKLRVRNAAAEYVPEFGQNGKEDITLLQLLTHQSGLLPDNALRDYNGTPRESFRRIYELGLQKPPGEAFIYSDVGFLMLADIVEKVAGQNVHEFSQANIFGPLGMHETGYLPREELRKRAAVTQEREGHWMQGEVHDPRAYRLGGIAGHAGLFSTAEDLAIYAQMMLAGGSYHGVRVLGPATVELMTRPVEVPRRGLRGLGWDMRTGYSSNRGENFSPSAFGHGGFTGTAMWIDPELDLFVIFLSNRVHPDGKGSVNPLAGTIGTIAASAIRDRRPQRRAEDIGLRPVKTGIDVLRESKFKFLDGKRVGLITNHTGLDCTGQSTVTLLHKAQNVNLTALFSPEHGFEGKLDVSRIGDSTDQSTGLRVHSLYGETRQPTSEMLADVDVLVFDIQDIGARFYTYISTMGLAMQAAAKNGKQFVVLDRPNPINGVDVDGPVLDAGSESFVGFHRLPVRHGMTAGELALMLNDEQKIGVDLHVVPVAGWDRRDFYDATGLTWVNPSPNMRNLNQALLYPGVGLLETTNVSVGRGTDTPFEILGAPWIDGRQLSEVLNQASLEGVRFVPVEFTPDSSKFAGETCGGVQIVITNRNRVEPLEVGFEIARQLRLLFIDDWQTKSYNRLLNNRQALEDVLAGKEVREIVRNYAGELEAFKERREGFLLYP